MGDPTVFGGWIMNPLRLFWANFKITAMYEMQYRINFFLQVFQSLVQLAIGIVAISLVFSHTDSLAGWSRYELLSVMGVHILLGGILGAFVLPSTSRLMRDIEEGQFDYSLVLPVDAQLYSSIKEFSFWSLTDVVVGAGVIGYSMNQMGSEISIGAAASFLVLLGCGALVMYDIFFLFAMVAFKFVRVNRLQDLANGLFQAGRWPVNVYPAAMRLALTFLIPLGFAVTAPAEVIADKLGPGSVLSSIAVTTVFMVVTRMTWVRSIRSYSGASA